MDCDIRHRRVLLTGSTGLIGDALRRQFEQCGIEVVRLGRHGPHAWNAASGLPPPAGVFAGISAVIQLAGSPIITRWTAAARRRIRNSRTVGTRALCEALATLPEAERPEVLVSMSGVAIYGPQRDELHLHEASTLAVPGASFLSDVAREWEEATLPASRAGIRTVTLRAGMVLAAQGGALPKMLLPMRCFLGGPAGPGTQRTPWISLDDLTSLIFFALRNTTLRGPVNAVAPHCVTNRELMLAIGAATHRPALVRVPAWALRLCFGRVADETVLANTAPFPAKLLEAGFHFKHPEVREALADILRSTPPKEVAGVTAP